MVKFGVRYGPVTPSPALNFLKIASRVYPFWANLYQKLPMLAILGAVSPHSKSDNGEIWREGTDLRHPTPRLIL